MFYKSDYVPLINYKINFFAANPGTVSPKAPVTGLGFILILAKSSI